MPPIVLGPITALVPIVGFGSTFTLDPGTRLGKQVEQLVDFVNGVSAHVLEVMKEVRRLDDRIDKSAADAAQAADQALADMAHRFNELKKQIDRSQVLDLRIAIWGIAITVVGLILSYF